MAMCSAENAVVEHTLSILVSSNLNKPSHAKRRRMQSRVPERLNAFSHQKPTASVPRARNPVARPRMCVVRLSHTHTVELAQLLILLILINGSTYFSISSTSVVPCSVWVRPANRFNPIKNLRFPMNYLAITAFGYFVNCALEIVDNFGIRTEYASKLKFLLFIEVRSLQLIAFSMQSENRT